MNTHRLKSASVASSVRGSKAAVENANSFVDQLTALPLSAWLAVGQRLATDDQDMVVRQAAWNEVERIVAGDEFAVVAWHLREAVDTAAALAKRGIRAWSRSDRCNFASAHHAAEVAALAQLSSAYIPPETLRLLCKPFAAALAASPA